jgi:hypothetical protein
MTNLAPEKVRKPYRNPYLRVKGKPALPRRKYVKKKVRPMITAYIQVSKARLPLPVGVLEVLLKEQERLAQESGKMITLPRVMLNYIKKGLGLTEMDDRYARFTPAQRARLKANGIIPPAQGRVPCGKIR